MANLRKTERRVIRLATGPFESPAATVRLPPDSAGGRFLLETERSSTKRVQELFLNAVAYVAPAVLVTLHGQPLTALQESKWSPGMCF
jgi:hypothetical protein